MSSEERRSARGPTPEPLRVLVGGRQPLERELVRFFLEEGAVEVVAKVSRAVDAVAQTAERRPDAVVLFESVAAEGGGGLIRRVRQACPGTKIVVITPTPEEAWRGSLRGADAFLEEFEALQQLEVVLLRLCRDARVAPQPKLPGSAQPTAGDEEAAASRGTASRQQRLSRWYERAQGAAVACLIVVALLLGRGFFPGTPSPPQRPVSAAATAHLHQAYSFLETLVQSMRQGSPRSVIVRNGRALFMERAAAMGAGADVSRLDAAIGAEVPSLLPNIPDRAAAAVVAILGNLGADAGLVPNAAASTGPGPSLSPGPEPSASPEPSPTESPSPEPSPSESPSPEPSPEPSPTESPSPVPSPDVGDAPSEEP